MLWKKSIFNEPKLTSIFMNQFNNWNLTLRKWLWKKKNCFWFLKRSLNKSKISSIISIKEKITKKNNIFVKYVVNSLKAEDNWAATCQENIQVKLWSTFSRKSFAKLKKLKETEENISKILKKRSRTKNKT